MSYPPPSSTPARPKTDTTALIWSSLFGGERFGLVFHVFSFHFFVKILFEDLKEIATNILKGPLFSDFIE